MIDIKSISTSPPAAKFPGFLIHIYGKLLPKIQNRNSYCSWVIDKKWLENDYEVDASIPRRHYLHAVNKCKKIRQVPERISLKLNILTDVLYDFYLFYALSSIGKRSYQLSQNHTYFEGKGRHGVILGTNVLLFDYGRQKL